MTIYGIDLITTQGPFEVLVERLHLLDAHATAFKHGLERLKSKPMSQTFSAHLDWIESQVVDWSRLMRLVLKSRTAERQVEGQGSDPARELMARFEDRVLAQLGEFLDNVSQKNFLEMRADPCCSRSLRRLDRETETSTRSSKRGTSSSISIPSFSTGLLPFSWRGRSSRQEMLLESDGALRARTPSGPTSGSQVALQAPRDVDTVLLFLRRGGRSPRGA